MNIATLGAASELPLVLPGHPLVIAVAIMTEFESYADARAADENGVTAAESDPRIAGGATMVAEAMKVLKLVSVGTMPADVITYARDRWFRDGAPGDGRLAEAGEAQARRVEGEFSARSKAWNWS